MRGRGAGVGRYRDRTYDAAIIPVARVLVEWRCRLHKLRFSAMPDLSPCATILLQSSICAVIAKNNQAKHDDGTARTRHAGQSQHQRPQLRLTGVVRVPGALAKPQESVMRKSTANCRAPESGLKESWGIWCVCPEVS